MSSSWAIVAIPAQDDYVWNLSSEKIPHLTILFLGEQDETQASKVADFVGHAASTMLTRFGLSVDRRGTLGDEDADVVFFEKEWSFKQIDEFRGALLKNDLIHSMYTSTSQYPEWTPHLTMGYPQTPAKKDPRDYPGTHWINFDRIALWTGDYEGPEFILDHREDLSMSMTIDEFLAHYGVKGMKWGVRKDRVGRSGPQEVTLKSKPGRRVTTKGGRRQPASEDAKRTATSRQKAKKSTTDSLSTKELQELVTRMNLENQYKNLARRQRFLSKGEAFVDEILGVQRTTEKVKRAANK